MTQGMEQLFFVGKMDFKRSHTALHRISGKGESIMKSGLHYSTMLTSFAFICQNLKVDKKLVPSL